jgi:hypothetical protein
MPIRIFFGVKIDFAGEEVLSRSINIYEATMLLNFSSVITVKVKYKILLNMKYVSYDIHVQHCYIAGTTRSDA